MFKTERIHLDVDDLRRELDILYDALENQVSDRFPSYTSNHEIVGSLSVHLNNFINSVKNDEDIKILIEELDVIACGLIIALASLRTEDDNDN